ncbi:MAG TPA: alpha/beta hydrolase family protein [Pyrinomonadaceae bacterium]|nr:alpha/beta hydrolase family protein [Pyrinomonadaceae bacterium]
MITRRHPDVSRLRRARAWLLPLLFLCAFPAVVPAQPPSGARDYVELLPLQPTKTETIQFESKLAGRVLPYKVVLPPYYELGVRTRRRYPVLFLLHGFGGSHADWLSKSKLAEYAAEHRMIVVTPEGANGWYTDSAGVASDKFESYIVEELIADVARRFRTIEAREGRAVAGLSMGGYGALKFGVKHPEKFVLAASMSGAVGAASWRSEDDLPGAWPALRRSLTQTFGPADGPAKASNDLFKLLRELAPGRTSALPFLYLDCGTEDELGLLAANRNLADLLVARKIPHEYRQLPGRHNWDYWDRQVREVLRLAERTMTPARAEAARRPPGRFRASRAEAAR